MFVTKRFRPWAVVVALALAAGGPFSSRAFASNDDDSRAIEVNALQAQLAVLTAKLAAAQSTDDQIRALQEQIVALTKKLDELTKKQEETKKDSDKVQKLLKGFYGTLDVSFDVTTKGIDGKTGLHYDLPGATPVIPPLTNPPTLPASALTTSLHAPPVGNLGWLPALSTNKSGIGYRGEHQIGKSDTKFVFQLEAAFSITSSPGLATSYVQQSNITKSGLGYGDSFVGLANKGWGSIKFGTVYAPYKKSTDVFNPFSGQLGDYAVVMGNTGGDNRVEFGTRLDHSIWWESPKIGDGLHVDILFSPGQNRTYDAVVQSAGSPDCPGGNEPGSGNLPLDCSDGGFTNAFSADVHYEAHNFYVVGAYEWHDNVNRNSDGIGSNNYQYVIFAAANPNLVESANNNPEGLPPSGLGSYIGDVGDEWAAKAGVLYHFPGGFTVGGIYEWLRRQLPAYYEFQNERSRDGSWIFASLKVGKNGLAAAGWARAGNSVGDPGGQHNYNPLLTDNTADMLTIMYKHTVDKQLEFYADYANTVNHGNAHYDLGAGGRGLTTDCHDGTNTVFVDYSGTGPTTWGSCHLEGFSFGVHYKF
jgi:predicted porin